MSAQDVLIRPGMSESSDARLLPISPLATPRLLKNVRTRQANRIEKRPGTEALATSGLPGTAYGSFVAEHRGLTVAGIESASVGNTRGRLTYALTQSETQWVPLGRHGMVVPDRRFSIGPNDISTGRCFAAAAVGSTVYVAYTDTSSGTELTLLAVDLSGTVIQRYTQSNTARPRLVYVNSVLYLVWRDASGAGTTLNAQAVATGSSLGMSGSPTSVGTLVSSFADFDVAPMEGGTTWCLAYPESGVLLRVKVLSGTTTSVSQTHATLAEAGLIGIAGATGDSICVAYSESGTIKARLVDASTLASLANPTLRTPAAGETHSSQCGVVRTASGTFVVAIGGDLTVSSPTLETGFVSVVSVTSGGASSPYDKYHFQPASKPFTVGELGSRQVTIWAHNRNINSQWSLQAAHYVLSLEAQTASNSPLVAAISYEHLATYGASLAFRETLPDVVGIAGSGTGGLTQFATVLQWEDPGGLAGVDMAVWHSASLVDQVSTAQRQTLSVNQALLISGGALYEVDSVQVDDAHYLPENGFPYDPAASVQIAAGGSLTADTEYTYRCVYRWYDTAGRVHRSAPSTEITVTTTTVNKTAQVRVATCAGTGRLGSASRKPVVELYRSWNNGPYYYVTVADATPTTPTVLITDAAADDTLGVRVLYTDLGIAPTDPPSGARLICVGGNRVWCVGWRANVVQFSKLILATAPIEFSDRDEFRVSVPEDITAIAHLDGALVIFSASSIYLVTGDGPNDQGVGVFADPRQLPSAVGADSPHVVEVPQGLMFYGAGTIWLLPRGFGPPQPVGDEIQETLAAYPHLRGAYLCSNADDDCTHFVLAASDAYSASTTVAIWDNRLGTWSLDLINGEVGAAGSVGGEFTWLLPTWSSLTYKPVRRLSTASYQDWSGDGATATWIESRIGFGDWRPFGLIGHGQLHRVLVLGERPGTCSVKLDLSYDGAAASLIATSSASGATTPLILDHHLEDARGSSWRFDIYDAESSGKTAGMVVHGLVIDATGEKANTVRRTADTERF